MRGQPVKSALKILLGVTLTAQERQKTAMEMADHEDDDQQEDEQRAELKEVGAKANVRPQIVKEHNHRLELMSPSFRLVQMALEDDGGVVVIKAREKFRKKSFSEATESNIKERSGSIVYVMLCCSTYNVLQYIPNRNHE